MKSGNSLTNYFEEDEVTLFLQQSNFIENERSYDALQDAKKAWQFINYFAYLDADILKMMHYILMQNLWRDIAGKYRDVPIFVGGRPGAISEAIPQMIDELLYTVPHNEETIKAWHVAYEKIHPFRDGNGRSGRIIMNWQRKMFGLPILIIREGMQQYEYYDWFREGEDNDSERTERTS